MYRRDGSVDKHAQCSPKGLMLNSQHPQQAAHGLLQLQVQGIRCPLSSEDTCGAHKLRQAQTHMHHKSTKYHFKHIPHSPFKSPLICFEVSFAFVPLQVRKLESREVKVNAPTVSTCRRWNLGPAFWVLFLNYQDYFQPSHMLAIISVAMTVSFSKRKVC